MTGQEIGGPEEDGIFSFVFQWLSKVKTEKSWVLDAF